MREQAQRRYAQCVKKTKYLLEQREEKLIIAVKRVRLRQDLLRDTKEQCPAQWIGRR